MKPEKLNFYWFSPPKPCWSCVASCLLAKYSSLMMLGCPPDVINQRGQVAV